MINSTGESKSKLIGRRMFIISAAKVILPLVSLFAVIIQPSPCVKPDETIPSTNIIFLQIF